MKIEIRNDTAEISGYVNAVGRDSRPIPDVRGKFVEQIEPGAFRAALERAEDVKLLLNHDKSKEYASVKGGDLTLTEDSIGLRARAVITDAELIGKARNGELRGWSFGMYVNDAEMEERAEGIPRRHVKGLDIFEVSLIDKAKMPCYAGTSVECRSDDGEQLAELRSGDDEEPEISEERSEPVDYSAVDDMIAEVRYGAVDNMLAEVRFNPYHDPSNGRFTSGGGGFSGVDKSGENGIIEVGSDKVTISSIEVPIEQQHTGKGNPNAILMFDVELNSRQKKLLDSLPDYDSRVIVPKEAVNMSDLSALTAKTGDEFAMFTRSESRLVIRGNSKEVNIDPEAAKSLNKQGYKWSGHTHPGTSDFVLTASDGDKSVLQCFDQEQSVIYNSLGHFRTFETD